MARILVTGGTGYIGSHTVVELMQKGYDVVIVDNLSNSNQAVLDGITAIVGSTPDFVQADCCDQTAMDALFAQYKDIEGVIHFAAISQQSACTKSGVLPTMAVMPSRTA